MKLRIWQCHEVVSPLVLRQNQYQSCCFLLKKKAVEKFRWLKTRTLENLFGKGSASNRRIYTIAAAGVFMLKCNAFVTYVIDVTTSNMTMPLHCTESCFVYDVGYLNEWVARSFGTLRARSSSKLTLQSLLWYRSVILENSPVSWVGAQNGLRHMPGNTQVGKSKTCKFWNGFNPL